VLNGGECFARHCDWRLPTVEELETIVDDTQGCCIDPIFGPTIATPEFQFNSYWSSTTLEEQPNFAYEVYFNALGETHTDWKTHTRYVRAGEATCDRVGMESIVARTKQKAAD
jgi:uncharacterized protein DUF1566